MDELKQPWPWQLLLNVLGGVLAAGVLAAVEWWRRASRGRGFKKVFGDDVAKPGEYHLVYGEYVVRPEILEQHPYPFHKPRAAPGQPGLSTELPVSSSALRGVKYLTEAISRQVRTTPTLVPDSALRERLDISFISLGGPSSNYKSNDALANRGNPIVTMETNAIVCRGIDKQGEPWETRWHAEGDFDCGLVLKIHPTQFPERTWIVCAGLGEWGSSGAAWYLANKWRIMRKNVPDRRFALIVKVRRGQDESAEVACCYMIGTPDEIGTAKDRKK